MASPPLGLRLGACAHCRALKHVTAQGLCHECVLHFTHLRRRQRDQERLLTFGLEDGPALLQVGQDAGATTRRTAAPLFVLCVTYLSNNTDLIEPEAIYYLPSEVRYFLFLLELSNKQFSHSAKSSSGASSSAPRLRLAKRFLSPSNSSPSFASPFLSSFQAFDFCALKSLTCLSPLQIENVFDYLTSFGRPSVEGLRILSLKGLPFITDAALKAVAHLRQLRVLDVSFCDAITDDGVAALLPRLRQAAQTRDSWEELASDDHRHNDGDGDGHGHDCVGGGEHEEDRSDGSSLLSGLLHLRRLGIYGCSQLTRANLKALRLAFAGRAALTVYTSMLLVRGLDDDDGRAYAYDNRAAVSLATASASASAAHQGLEAAPLWDADTIVLDGHGHEWNAKVAEANGEKPRQGAGKEEEEEEASRVVTFINDTLQWTVFEEDAVYALHGYQIEEIAELRGRYYAPGPRRPPQQDGGGGGGNGGQVTIGGARRKVRPALTVPYEERFQVALSTKGRRKGATLSTHTLWS